VWWRICFAGLWTIWPSGACTAAYGSTDGAVQRLWLYSGKLFWTNSFIDTYSQLLIVIIVHCTLQFARLEDAKAAQSLNGQLDIAGRVIKVGFLAVTVLYFT
jgi:hypothetical protein